MLFRCVVSLCCSVVVRVVGRLLGSLRYYSLMGMCVADVVSNTLGGVCMGRSLRAGMKVESGRKRSSSVLS